MWKGYVFFLVHFFFIFGLHKLSKNYIRRDFIELPYTNPGVQTGSDPDEKPDPSFFKTRALFVCSSQNISSRHVSSRRKMTFAQTSPAKTFAFRMLNVTKHLETSKLAALNFTAAEVWIGEVWINRYSHTSSYILLNLITSNSYLYMLDKRNHMPYVS